MMDPKEYIKDRLRYMQLKSNLIDMKLLEKHPEIDPV